ncbi:S8 family serine peptidase [Acetobacterium bakii]|uniref:S8 family serine peptidase n=1 Tax=Acetobacterium bakii TaxID=52689 RepID=UPI001364CAFF|nr:S8 family serine peptidase [Acetobacterium bakii]
MSIIVLCLLSGSGIMAEDLVNENKETIFNENQETLVDNSKEATTCINSLEEIPDINIEENSDRQVVIIYANSGENNVKSLALNTKAIQSGKKVSERVDLLELRDGISVDDFISQLKTNPDVLAVDQNQVIKVSALPNDTYIQSGDAWQFEKIGAGKTWDKVFNNEPVVVAVIDSGLNVSHPDLEGRIAAGYDYVNDTADVIDMAGHGTMVSGCIAAVNNNGIGIAGVAGMADIRIAPYRTGGVNKEDRDLQLAYICAAIIDAASRPEVKVINMSFGGYNNFATLKTAVADAADAGKILVSAAGNEGDLVQYAGKYSYPASYENVISVAATTNLNGSAAFSQYNNQVDLSAPGLELYTTTMNGGYAIASGTSFSAPIISGACAVLKAVNANLSASEVEKSLKDTALDLGNTGRDNYFGNGLVRLDAAVESISPAIPTEDLSTTYRTHVENIGWQSWRDKGAISGTSGQSLRLEGIEIKINTSGYDLGVQYQTHVENIGWQGFQSDGNMSGTTGRSLRLEAIQIQLTGTDNRSFDVYYQVHAQNYGWLDWAKNGESAGTEGKSLRLEAIKIVVVPKGNPAPGPTAQPFVK